MDVGVKFMKVLSLLMIWTLPLLQPSEHGPSLSPPPGRGDALHAGILHDPASLDPHPDHPCPCDLADGSLAGAFEDDDSFEEILLDRDSWRSTVSPDRGPNALASPARGHDLSFRAARTLPLLC